MTWIDSELIYTIRSKKFGIIGYLVIDRTVNGNSFGGIRIVPDKNLYALQLSARTMTYKNAFIGNNTGGAKAAVIIKDEKYKKDILVEFGKGISKFIKNGMYSPVMDMGITIDELQIIFESANYKCNMNVWKNLSHEYTAYTCYYATLCALKKLNKKIEDVTFSVQGYGNVGSNYANLMYKAGARFTALSNKYYGIENNDGFNADELFKEKLAKGDNFIFAYKDKQTSHNSILEKDVNVLLPAAGALAINKDNWQNIKADIIVCAANAPIPYDIERSLFKIGKIVITDFVANSGGTLGSIMDNYVDNDTILHIISTSYKRKVENILNKSTELNRPMVDIIIEEVEERLNNGYYKSNKIIENMIDVSPSILSNQIKKLTNKEVSKKYIDRYDTLWRN